MAITYTVAKTSCGKLQDGRVLLTGTITNAGTYATGGSTGLGAALASYMTTIYAVNIHPSANAYSATYIRSSDKVVLMDVDSEVANGEANTEVFDFEAIGSEGAA